MDIEILMTVSAKVGQCRGRDRAIKRLELAEACGISGRKVQEAVAILINDYGLFIGSHPTLGYWMMETEEELELARRNLRGRALKMLRRLSKLEKKSVEEVFGQLLLDL